MSEELDAVADSTPAENLEPDTSPTEIDTSVLDAASPPESGEEASEPEALTSPQMIAALNAQDYKGSELMDVLAQLETLITQARSLPMSASVLVNKAEALSLLDSARNAMPADIRIANQIVAGANAVIARSQEEAAANLDQANSASERIQADAHARAEQLVNQERIVVMAKERAEQIIEAATRKAADLAAGADRYSLETLEKVQDMLKKLGEQAQAGTQVLRQRSKFDPQLSSREEKNPDE